MRTPRLPGGADPARSSRRAALLGACAAAAVAWGPAPASSAEYRVTHAVETTVTYTDNIDLAPDDEAEEAIIWTNTGATSIRAVGSRAEAALDAALSLDTIFEDDTDVNLRPNARGLGTVELLEDRLFIDGRASARVALEDPFSAVSASPASGRRSQAEVYTVGVSPYLVQRFGDWADSELRYRHDRIYVDDDDNVGDTVTNAASLRTTTGSRFTRLLLRNDLEYEDVDSDDGGGEFERATALLSSQYVLTRQLSLLGAVGYEKIESDDLIDDPEGLVWNVGALVRPGPRSEFRFTFGERYDATNIAASARYDISQRLAFRASYTEVLDTTGARIGRETFDITVDEEGRLIDARTGLPIESVEDLFALERETFIAERFQTALTGNFGRNDFVLLATHEMRQFDFRPDEELFTTSGQISHALTPATRVGLFAAYRSAERKSPGTLDTETVLGRLHLTHELAQNVHALAAYSYSERFSDNAGAEYSENAVTLGLRVTF